MLIPDPRKYSCSFLYLFTALILVLIFIEFSWLGFDALQSDVAAYWNDSIHWQTPYHSFHVPGYPLLIAGLRGMTGSLLPPLIYMILITSTSLLVGMVVASQIGILFGGRLHIVRLMMPFLLAFWPLTGLYAVIYPIADYVVIAFFLGGLLLFMRDKPLFGSIIWAGAAIIHKAIWPFIALSYFAWFLQNRKQLRLKWLIYLMIIIAPLFLIWLGGTQYHNDFKWILSSNINEIQDNKVWFPFHGIIESFQLGDLASLLKGSVTLGYVILAVILAVYLIRSKSQYYLYGIAIIISSLIMAMSMNEGLTWGFVRFSRLLIIPLGVVFVNKLMYEGQIVPKWQEVIIVVVCLLCVLSQFVYAFYMGKFYYV